MLGFQHDGLLLGCELLLEPLDVPKLLADLVDRRPFLGHLIDLVEDILQEERDNVARAKETSDSWFFFLVLF